MESRNISIRILKSNCPTVKAVIINNEVTKLKISIISNLCTPSVNYHLQCIFVRSFILRATQIIILY